MLEAEARPATREAVPTLSQAFDHALLRTVGFTMPEILARAHRTWLS